MQTRRKRCVFQVPREAREPVITMGFKTVTLVSVDWRSRENGQKAVATVHVSDGRVRSQTAQVGIESGGQIPVQYKEL